MERGSAHCQYCIDMNTIASTVPQGGGQGLLLPPEVTIGPAGAIPITSETEAGHAAGSN